MMSSDFMYIHMCVVLQAGICSFFAIHKMICGGDDLDIVGKAKEAAGPIYKIIDMVYSITLLTYHINYVHEITQPGPYH